MENGSQIQAHSQNLNIEALSKPRPQSAGSEAVEQTKEIQEPVNKSLEDLVELNTSNPPTVSERDKPPAEAVKQPEKEVTVLLYMDGQYPDLESTMASIPVGLESVGSNQDMNIVLQLARAPQSQVHPDGGADRVDNDWEGVRRYYVQKQDQPRKESVSLSDWSAIAGAHPDNPLIHYVLGEIYESQGMKEESDKEFKKAEELGYMKFFTEPFNPQVKDWSKEFQEALQPLRDKDAAANVYASPVVQDLGTGVDMKHPHNLQDFVSWGMKNYPAKHYVVVLGGHGGAWTGALQMSPSDIGMALQAGNHQANRQSGRNDGIDALALNSCYMGNLESLNEMKGAADVILASEMSAKSSVLKDWPEILAQVQKDIAEGKQFDAKEFGKEFVEHYQQKGDEIKDLPLMKKFSREHYLTLAAVDTSKLDAITTAWRDFIKDWQKTGADDTEIFKAINDSKNYPSFAYTPEMLFDFGTLRDLGSIADKISGSDKLPEKIRSDARDIKKALEDAIIAEQHTGHSMEGSTGLSVWAPTNASDIALMAAPYGKRVPDFVQQTNWDKKLSDAVNTVDSQQLGKFMKCIRLLAQIQQSLKGSNLSEDEQHGLEEKQKLLKSEVIKLRDELSLVRQEQDKDKLELVKVPVDGEGEKGKEKQDEYIEKTIKSSQGQDGMSHGKGLYTPELVDLDTELVDNFKEDILNDSQTLNGMGGFIPGR